MKQYTNPSHLASDQYRNATNLNARVALHTRFSTNRQGWMPWVFDRLGIQTGERTLELGCGPGHLWAQNLARLPAGCQLTLTDLSAGMVAEAQRNVEKSQAELDTPSDVGLRYEVVDAQDIPFENDSYDVVIANHMLYHVPDRERALAQMRRVLRPQGRFFASTVGRAHLIELTRLVTRFGIATGLALSGQVAETFGLETGEAKLSTHFANIRLHLYNDGLVVTEAEPLMAYVTSSMAADEIEAYREELAALACYIEDEIAAQGAIHVTKATGLFEAVKP